MSRFQQKKKKTTTHYTKRQKKKSEQTRQTSETDRYKTYFEMIRQRI